MTSETLHCRCGIEVRIVRLNPETLTFGHVRNPGLGSHPVRLAPVAASEHRHSGSRSGSAAERLPEAADTLRAAANAVASHPLTTRRQAGQSEGSTRSRVSPSGISSPAGRASQSGVAPRPRLRPARSAGSETAGEGV